MKWRRNLLLVFLSVVGTLFTCEIGFRWSQLISYKRSLPKRTGDLLLLPDDPQAFALKPDIHGAYPFLEAPKKRFHYKTNHLGLRDQDRGEKVSGAKRAVVIGDSYTFGYAIEEQEAFPQVTERLLHERGYGDFEVINGGIPGYNTVQEERELHSLLPQLKPDIVVLAYVMNDAEPQGAVPASPKQIFRYARFWAWEELKDRANVTFFGGRTYFAVSKNLPNPSYLEGFKAHSPKWKDSRSALSEIRTTCGQAGVSLLVLILPDFTQPFDSRYPFDQIHAAVSLWGQEFGIPTYDLMPVFRNRDHVDLQVKEDGHPNARAHQQIAEFLTEQILDLIGVSPKHQGSR